jgi:hypothetical protein
MVVLGHICRVMAGLVPAIPIVFAVNRDPRDKPAGDVGEWAVSEDD